MRQTISELQTEYLPGFSGRLLRRPLRLAKARMRRSLRAVTRKIVRACTAWYRRQYFLTSSFRDVRTASRANEDIVLALVIVSGALAYAYATVTSELIYLFFEAAYAIAEILDLSMVALSAITLAVIGSSLAWVAAFCFNSMSIALMHGLTGKKNRSLRSTMRLGLRYTSRTATAWMLVAAIIFLPLAAALMLGIAFLKFGNTDLLTALAAAPYAVIAGVAWILYAVMQYSLVPYIAIFEPQRSFSQVFARSHELVRSKGRIFLLSLYMALLIAVSAVVGLSFILEDAFGIDQSLVVAFGSSLAFLAMNAVMAVFYRKRRLARK
jgi:hypothetical protein